MPTTHQRRRNAATARPKTLNRAGREDGDGRQARLELLYAIGQKLTRARRPKELIPEVLSVAATALSLRSAVLALRVEDETHLIAWPTNGLDVEGASNHALATFAYLLQEPDLASRGVEILRGAISAGADARHPREDDTSLFVTLPLAVARRPIFGALQLECSAPLGDDELRFVDAIVTELAAALDRGLTVERRIADSDRSRAAAEAGAATARDHETRSREERDFARAVTRSLGEGVVVVGLDSKIALLNPAAEALLGWKEAAALGRDFAEVVRVRDSVGAPIAPEQGPAARAMHTRAEVRDDAHLFVDRGGTAFPVSFTACPVVREGAVQGAVVAFANVTALRRAEREQRTLADLGASLGASLDFLETITAVCRTLVPQFADMCFVDVARGAGRAERSGVVFADAAKERLADAVRAQAPLPGWTTPQAQALATGKAVLVASPAAVLAGAQDHDQRATLRDVGVTSQVVVPLEAHGRIFGALTCATAGSGRLYHLADLALAQGLARRAALALENARLYQELQAAMHAREEILAVVSHDLRNPLSGIVLGAKMLQRSVDRGEHAVSLATADRIFRAGMRMNALVERLLDFSRLELGQLALKLEDSDLAALVAEAVATVEPVAADKGITLRSEVEPELPHVRCDADRILQVMGNLLGNALKFTPEGGTIEVRTERQGRSVHVSVSDTGPGIPAAHRANIFQAFWQAEPGVREGGAGLGLAIARGIVDAHSGRIWVESEIGVGSTFVVALPVA